MTSQAEPLVNLMNYYRDRIESHEHERRHWYQTLDKLRLPQDYVHKLDWEIKKRNEEISEMNRVLKDSHIALFNTREELKQIKEGN